MASFKNVLAATALGLASAHLCTTSPLQRGGATGAGSPAADICAQGAGPCGSVPAGAPTAAYFAGEQHHIDMCVSCAPHRAARTFRVFSHTATLPDAPASRLKNLDHFNASNPGNFSAYLWDAAGTSTFLALTVRAPSTPPPPLPPPLRDPASRPPAPSPRSPTRRTRR